MGGREWFTRPVPGSRCGYALLQSYFKINATHAYGRQCPETRYAALHVRSGDVVAGKFNSTTGSYMPAIVDKGYGPYPTAYYVAVVNEVRRKGITDIMVFCETDDNPTCKFFEKAARLDPRLIVSIGNDLVDDLYWIACAEEVAISRGTFVHVYSLSPRNQHKHRFSLSESNYCSSWETFYWIKNLTRGNLFNNVEMSPWKNSEFQRHLINTDFEMGNCTK